VWTSDGPCGCSVSAPAVEPVAASEPVDGGTIVFTLPASGASAATTSRPATISGGTASGTATANATATAGSYTVTASTPGVSGSAGFDLTNTPLAMELITFVVR
jgi:hypothetical protein